MKKQKNIIMIILIVIVGWIVLQIIKFIFAGGLFGVLFYLESQQEFTVLKDASQYDKSHYIETYNGDLDSALFVFPDIVCDDMNVNRFESSFKTGLFDTYGYIVLDYTLEQDKFIQEVARLQALEATIENYDGKVHTNTVLYAEDDYAYPAYITIDGYADTFEYALIDEENSRIVCVYLAYIDSAEFPYEEYLKLDKSCYNDMDNLDEFSMYTHSFDGGRSFMEYDDSVRLTYP